MTLTDAQRVRLKIQDIPAIADTTQVGDGLANTFALPHRNLTSGTAFVVGAGGWTATAATFDPSGFVALATAIAASSALRTRYVHSVFSDAEIEQWLVDGGGVVGAAKEAVTTLMFDGLKRARWSSPDGTSYDDTRAIDLLKHLYETLDAEQQAEAVTGGSLDSWSLSQGDY